ncbi:hypothetical protein N3K66_003429 [Trichothecium roseum]|uniref:Uncharacterized protein n=1 Tax=Trichothecium roseum TaxID=47278 RepID=A0ACC0V811_9HYPO|nr:hypothetical protein N3K66_003429 [Trichothecium roseum]
MARIRCVLSVELSLGHDYISPMRHRIWKSHCVPPLPTTTPFCLRSLVLAEVTNPVMELPLAGLIELHQLGELVFRYRAREHDLTPGLKVRLQSAIYSGTRPELESVRPPAPEPHHPTPLGCPLAAAAVLRDSLPQVYLV